MMNEIKTGDKFIVEIADTCVNPIVGGVFYKIKDASFALTEDMLKQLQKVEEDKEESIKLDVLELIRNIAELEEEELIELFGTSSLNTIVLNYNYTEMDNAWKKYLESKVNIGDVVVLRGLNTKAICIKVNDDNTINVLAATGCTYNNVNRKDYSTTEEFVNISELFEALV